MDIMLIDPPYTSLKGIATKRGYHVGLTSLAAYLRAGEIESGVLMGDLLTGLSPYDSVTRTNVKIYAAGQRDYEAIVDNKNHYIWKKFEDNILRTKPKAVGISYLTPLKCVVERIAELIKDIDKDIPVITGSFHPTFCPEEVMQNPNIDFVVVGEGEIPLLSLLRELKSSSPKLEKVPGIYYRDKDGTIKNTPKARPIENLDELPFLARDLVLNCDYNAYRVHSIYTTRGCPYTCSFCSDRGFWGGKVRRRSVDNVVKELRFLKNKFKKIEYIDIVDGTFTFDKKYLKSFCDTLIKEKLSIKWRCTARYDNLDEEVLYFMKESGCSGIYLGAESGSDRILKEIDKKISTKDILRISRMVYESGILSATSILLGLPGETKEDLEKTIKLMKTLKTDILDVNSYIPLPGTQLYNTLSETERKQIDWKKVGYKSYDNCFSKNMTLSEFNQYKNTAYKISDRLQKKTIIRLGIKMVWNFFKGAFKKPFEKIPKES